MCAIGDGSGRLVAEHRFTTGEPRATLAEACRFLGDRGVDSGPLAAVGLAAFGPLDLDLRSPGYGRMLRTPKVGWSGADLLAMIAEHFPGPVGLDTDVNAAARAEHRWGAARGLDTIVYVTVGTGIGGGVLVDGAPLENLADSDPQWEIEADYLGQLCAQLVLTVAPRRILLGGGVMSQDRLFPAIRARTRVWLRGYVDREALSARIEEFIVPPGLGTRSGVLGALALAIEAAVDR